MTPTMGLKIVIVVCVIAVAGSVIFAGMGVVQYFNAKDDYERTMQSTEEVSALIQKIERYESQYDIYKRENAENWFYTYLDSIKGDMEYSFQDNRAKLGDNLEELTITVNIAKAPYNQVIDFVGRLSERASQEKGFVLKELSVEKLAERMARLRAVFSLIIYSEQTS